MGKTLQELLTQEEIEDIIAMYQNNMSLREIERLTHHGRPQIAKMLENFGIKTTSGNHYRKYFFDFDFFEKIDNELKAYWLGFMYADGCVLPQNKYGEQEIQLTLAKQDEQSIIDFKYDLKSTYPIRYDDSKNKKNKNAQIQVIMKMRSQKTVEDLKKLGCVEKKSLILTFPTEQQVPSKLIHHFIRGYFDGDGSIFISNNRGNISFVGTKDFITTLSTYFNYGTIIQDQRKNNSWYLNTAGQKSIEEYYNFMYKDATRYMQRKYDKFQEILLK